MRRRKIVPKGLKPVHRTLASGERKTYWYHRATSTRLQHDPWTAEGLLEVSKLDQRADRRKAALEAPKPTLDALWLAYLDSPQWSRLKPRTQADYKAVRDWLGDGAKLVEVRALTRTNVTGLRDKAANQRGRRFGNYTLQVVRLLLEWGRDRGWVDVNPAMGLKQIRKPTGERLLNRAWLDHEIEAFARVAPHQLALPFALALFGAMRQGDALRVTWRSYDENVLRWTASKNGEPCIVPVTGPFKTLLDSAKAHRGDALQIATNSKGLAWTESGFRASFFKLVRSLEQAGEVGRGLTFHGLRHTIGLLAREAGESEFRVAAAIGDRSTAMAQTYGRDADRNTAQTVVLQSVQKRFGNIGLENKVENVRS